MPKETVYKPTETTKKQFQTPLQKEFSWLVDNSKRITGNGFANVTASTVLYTVPEGKLLYITNLSLTASNSAVAGSDSVHIKVANKIIFEMYVYHETAIVNTVPLSLPLILEAGEQVKIFAGADAKVIGSFIGYEIAKKRQQNKGFIT